MIFAKFELPAEFDVSRSYVQFHDTRTEEKTELSVECRARAELMLAEMGSTSLKRQGGVYGDVSYRVQLTDEGKPYVRMNWFFHEETK